MVRGEDDFLGISHLLLGKRNPGYGRVVPWSHLYPSEVSRLISSMMPLDLEFPLPDLTHLPQLQLEPEPDSSLVGSYPPHGQAQESMSKAVSPSH